MRWDVLVKIPYILPRNGLIVTRRHNACKFAQDPEKLIGLSRSHQQLSNKTATDETFNKTK